MESSCRHLTTKSGAFQPLFKTRLNLGGMRVLPTGVFHKCITSAFSQGTDPDTGLCAAASVHVFLNLLLVKDVFLEKASLEENMLVISANTKLNVKRYLIAL